MTNQNEAYPFEGHEPIAGLEHLGRHIRDADGNPSGSPANFEYLRGATQPGGNLVAGAQSPNQEALLALVRAEYGDTGQTSNPSSKPQ